MDRMKKVLSSPITKKRNVPFGQYFGIPLEELVNKEGTLIPHLVTQVCKHITKMGFNYEGIFRVSGNARIQEKLRASFDKSGDADFDEVNDIMAVAGLLKMFIRELPEAVIPEKLTTTFVNTQQAYAHNNVECLKQFKEILKQLPDAHYNTLKVLIEFLVRVSLHEETNKMSPMALAIVFGPNLFRWSAGFAGLRQQGTTNQVTFQFIKYYNDLFTENLRNTTRESIYEKRSEDKMRDKPNRPPPPKFIDETSAQVPPSKKINQFKHNIISSNGMQHEIEETSSNPQSNSEDEYMETANSVTSTLDSEYSNGGNVSTRTDCSSPVSNVISELISTAISTVVSERLFGDNDSSSNSPVDTPKESHGISKTEDPVPVPRKSKFYNKVNQKELISREQSDDYATQMYIGSSMETLTAVSGDVDMNFDDIQPDDTLKLIKRPNGPKNRRNPSRLSLERNSGIKEEVYKKETEENNAKPMMIKSNVIHPVAKSLILRNDQYYEDEIDVEYMEDINHNNIPPTSMKPSTEFLNKFHNGSKTVDISPDHSPVENRKPYIPPLDLSILHSSVDGEDPIPAVIGQSMNSLESYKYNDDVMLSPRMSKHKRKNRLMTTNTNSAPSPPATQSNTHFGFAQQEEDAALIMKRLTKKIHTCKKKIKAFEEIFEKEHGYKPSQSDKVAKAEIKLDLQELSHARKDFRRFKEELLYGGDYGWTCISPGSAEEMETPETEVSNIPSIEETYYLLETRLREKRKGASRPNDLKLMNVDQLCDEKLAVQKALLQFESLHGRPTAKHAKEIMKPLYDHYRAIKKLLPSLQSVPEDHPIEFPAGMEDNTSKESLVNSENDATVNNPLDFIITQNVSLLLKDTLQNVVNSNDFFEQQTNLSPNAPGPPNTWKRDIHKLSKSQLFEEVSRANVEKKRLRKVLRQFENEFSLVNGRKVQKEDRTPMESEYLEYKQVKAKLKLLDALMSKGEL